MKYTKYGLVLSFIIGGLGVVGSFKVPKSFGRTHFIVGYPQQYYKEYSDKEFEISQVQSDSGSQKTTGVHSVLFAPDDDVQQALVRLITGETDSIKMAIFMITTKEIVQALLEAHTRGVKITVITDTMCVRDRWSKIELLKKAGITVYQYIPTTHGRLNDLMHNKFVIFSRNIDNKALVWTGSFNFTRSAQLCNQENAVVLNDTETIEKFIKQFKRIKKRSKRM